jgi:hypothetical protein
MTSAQIVGLGVRLFAIWLVVSVLQHVPLMWQFSASVESSGSTYVVTVAVGALLLVLAAGLWFFPLAVANTLIPSSSKTDYVQLSLDQAQSVGFTLLGLWVLASAVPDSFYWLFMIYQASVPETLFELRTSNYASMVSTAVRLILGIWLLFGARGLLGLLRWARSAGT